MKKGEPADALTAARAVVDQAAAEVGDVEKAAVEAVADEESLAAQIRTLEQRIRTGDDGVDPGQLVELTALHRFAELRVEAARERAGAATRTHGAASARVVIAEQERYAAVDERRYVAAFWAAVVALAELKQLAEARTEAATMFKAQREKARRDLVSAGDPEGLAELNALPPFDVHPVQFQSTAARIRASTSLTRDGKLQRLARAHADAKQALAQLQQDAEAQAVTDRQALTRKAFAVDASGPHSAVSTRDAFARVASVSSPGDAAALLAQAHQTGDEVLARAIAQRAYDNRAAGTGWTDVVNDYAASRPTAADAISKLQSTGAPSIQSKFTDAASYYVPTPQELSGLPPGVIQRLTDDGPEAA